ncbi:AAA family ATPase [Streptomyces sp. NPDC059917]|uniref:AAA family ATPase n=1 Tax=Streptomyces sp. NPDC059917 TaxID=3347002 RepID=UPI00365D3BA3
MTREPAPRTFARRLLVIAVTEYDDGTPAQQSEFRAGITAQVATVEGWWAGPGLDDSRRFTSVPAKRLDSLRDLREFLLDQELHDLADDEALVVYVTGHGLAPDNSPQHFLRLPASYEDRPLSTAFPTAELITTVLDSPATHVLVMVDSCFSGRLGGELTTSVKALRKDRHALGSLVVIVSGDDESRPRLGQFTNLLRAVHDHCADKANGYAEPHLSWQEWNGIVQKVFDPRTMADLHHIWPTRSLTVQRAQQLSSPCLPNPGHAGVEPVLDASLGQVGWTRTELDTYWIPPAAGAGVAGAPGWYFTGRAALVKRMLAFLEGEEGVLVVTGEAGSGKSALLARMVTLSDARFRSDARYAPLLDSIPDELDVRQGSVDAAVLARNADPDELSQALYAALGGVPGTTPESSATTRDAGPPARLRTLVQDTAQRRGKALTIVVDGIDEARNPTRVITDLLRPLADLRMKAETGERPAVRLLLGIRSPRQNTPAAAGGLLASAPDHAPASAPAPASAVGPSDLLSLLMRATHSCAPIRTDDAETTAVDVAAYVRALLRAPRADQHDDHPVPDPARHHELAEAVAREVSPSFLDARIAAEQLRAMRDLPDPDDSEWRRTLRQGTEALLREDLGEVALSHGTPAGELIAALTASAFGQGAGLPWADIWPTAVRALSPSPASDPDAVIQQVMKSRLNGYLTTAVEDGRTVYRPIHERIGETLRYAPHSLLDVPESGRPKRLSSSEVAAVHGRLTRAFGQLIPLGTDQAPHPYLRRHLIAHAAAAGLLDDVHVPKRFLPWETSGTVRAALGLPADPGPLTRNLASWARVEHFLGDAGVAARADSLDLSLLGLDLEEDEEDAIPSPTETLPATETPSAAETASATETASETEAGRWDDGHGSGATPLWNHLRVPGNLLGRMTAGLSSLVPFTLPDGSPLVAASDQHGEVNVWDPLTGTEFGLPFQRAYFARALAVLTGRGGEPLLAVGTIKGVWIYDPQSGDATPLPTTEAVFALAAFTTRDGLGRLAVGTRQGLSLYDPLAGELLYRRPLLDGVVGRAVTALSTMRLPSGRTLLAMEGPSGTLDVVDAETLDVVTVVRGVGGGVADLALYADPHGRPRLAAAFRTMRSVRTYDAWTGEENWAARITHRAVSIGLYPFSHNRTVLALGSGDGSVSLWDPGTGRELYKSPSDHTQRVTAVAAVSTEGELPLVLSGSLDRTVRVWKPTPLMSGSQIRLEELGDGSHMAVLPRTRGGSLLLGPTRSGGVTVRSAVTGRLRRRSEWPTEWNSGGLTALATHEWPDGSTRVIAGTAHGFIGCWDEANGWERLPVADASQKTSVRALATFPVGGTDRVVLISGTGRGDVHFHDLATGEPWADSLRTRGAIRALAALPSASGPLLAFATGHDVRVGRLGDPPDLRLPIRIGDVSSLAVCPAQDGSPLLATGGRDGCVRLWSPETPRKEVYPVLEGHRGRVSAIGLLRTPASSRPLLVTTGLHDTTVRLWDPWTGEELMRLVTGTSLTSLGVLPAGSGAADHGDPVIAFGGPAGMAAVTVR